MSSPQTASVSSVSRGGRFAALDSLASAKDRSVFFSGAGGCGMRGLAQFLLQGGWDVHGTDAKPWKSTDPLLAAGLKPWTEGQALPASSLVVRSLAVPETDPTWRAMVHQGARPFTYAEMLGAITATRPSLAVAGSHGKTTITAWLAWGMRRAGLDCGWLVGGEVPQLGSSSRWGKADQPLVVESCEYARTFHQLQPQWVALANVDAEHPDTYPGGYPEVEAAFREFVAAVPEDGFVFAGPEAPDLRDATPGQWLKIPPLADSVPVGLPGHHNRRNGALVAGVLRHFEVEAGAIAEILAGFEGAGRRLESLGDWAGALVVSDYAHHPVEVAATLQASQERWPNRRLVVVFQPHQARRFDRFRQEFTAALDLADALVLMPVFRARDPKELQPRSVEILEPLLARRERPVFAVADETEATEVLTGLLEEGDLLLCLGAGDLDAYARGMVRQA